MMYVALVVSIVSLAAPQKTLAHQVQADESDPAIERILVRGMTRLFVEDYAGAVAVFEEGLKVEPENPTLLASISQAKLALGDQEAARFFLRQALDLDKKNIDLWKKWAALNVELNDLEESVSALSYVIENHYPSWSERVQLSQLYFQAERYTDAIQVVDTGIRTDGTIPELLFERVQILEKMGRTEDLAETLSELIELRPGDTELYYRLAIARMRTGAWEEAETGLNELLEVDPDHEQGRQALSTVLSELGKTSANDGTMPWDHPDLPEDQISVTDLEEQVAANPGRTELNMQLADLLLERGEDLEAAKRFEQVYLSDPRHLEAWSKAIEAYASAGQAGRAIEISDEALLLFPGYIPVEVARVFALRAAGRDAEARQLAEKILQRPVDPRFSTHLQRLKQELDDA